MALYKESHELKEDIDNFECIRSDLEQSTGLNIELETIDEDNFFIHCDKFKTTIEANLDTSNRIVSLFFSPKRKGYIEYAFLNALNSYFRYAVEIPGYAKKKWKDLSVFEKLLKK